MLKFDNFLDANFKDTILVKFVSIVRQRSISSFKSSRSILR